MVTKFPKFNISTDVTLKEAFLAMCAEIGFVSEDAPKFEKKEKKFEDRLNQWQSLLENGPSHFRSR